MKVTPAPTPHSLAEEVHEDLKRLRKHRDAASVANLGRLAPTICDLLGAGDPHLARARLTHELLEAETSTEIDAAAAALGFAADGDTVLDRLSSYGQEVFLDQRQVRRLSDRGLESLAWLITTNWPTETVPQLTATIIYTGSGWEVHLVTKRLQVVEMRQPDAIIMQGDTTTDAVLEWHQTCDETWEHAHLREPIPVANTGQETSVSITWRGELWPKFNTQWHTTTPMAASESLGNKLMLRLLPGESIGKRT